MTVSWDYLIVTASNESQAAAYRSQLALRRRLGLLDGFKHDMVVADPEGKRVGSGGSTVYCLMCVLTRELAERQGEVGDRKAWATILSTLRILIIHAGGDSKRLPAYGPCGKIFVPVPGTWEAAVPLTLFDRQLPTYRALASEACGQVLVAGGDALVLFDPEQVRFEAKGLTALGCAATPKAASRHGVFVVGENRQVRLFLQKPSVAEQHRLGAVDADGNALLDLAIMSFDTTFATVLLRAFEVEPDASGALGWRPPLFEAIKRHGIDLFREICCAIGTEATAEHHRQAARGSGSTWPDENLERMFTTLNEASFSAQALTDSSFLHFGTTRQLLTSGHELNRLDAGVDSRGGPLLVNSTTTGEGAVSRADGWIEGCRIDAPLTIEAENVLVGVDVEQPLTLPRGACVDVLRGRTRTGEPTWFVRCYGITDQFKDRIESGATLCDMPVIEWLDAVGARPDHVWETDSDVKDQTLWNARVFPAVTAATDYAHWLWVFAPAEASAAEKKAWLKADRYSLAEMATLTDQEAFHQRRMPAR